MDDLPEGTRIAGRYDVIRPLGRGAVKVVYLARDILSRTEVALSLLVPRPGVDATVGPRFSREARAASVLTSPYVVRVLDVGKTEDGTRYLATEAVLGRGLDQVIEYGPAPTLAAAVWTAEVLTGLTEAHGRGVLHRDVKPENVLLAPTPGHRVGERARLTDFGLAKVLDAALEGSVMLRTAQGVVMGTADYMPPEQWLGGPVDPRTDLYAVGAMFHELLTGKPPFQGATLAALCAAHAAAPVEPFPHTLPDAVRAYEPVVRRALAKDPKQRFQGADEMRAAIERIGGFAIETSEVAGIEPEAPFVRAELVTDVGVGPVQLLAARRVVLGRAGHVVLRCVPFTSDNDQRARTLSRRHAQLEWRGGTGVLRDLGSASGTSVSGRPLQPGEDGVRLRDGDVLGLGPHVRLRYEHAAAPSGVLPAWARLSRVDPYGAGLVHLLVLTEAEVSADVDAAIRLPAAAQGDRVAIGTQDGELLLRGRDGVEVPLHDGLVRRVGRVTLTFARESARLL